MPSSSPAPAAPIEGRHDPILDGIRGAAILLVLVYHCCVLPARRTVDWVYWFFASNGWVGVDLFFVLSGFLITGILLDAKGSPHYFRNFYARRTLRIFPLYYAVVALSFLVLPRLLPPERVARFGSVAGDEIHYWLYLSNFSIARAQEFRHGVLDISWSLAIEEQFYLVWPAVVFLCSRKALFRAAIGLFAAAFAARVVLRFGFGVGKIPIYVLTPCRVDGLAVGAMLAVLAREPGGLLRLRRPARITAMVSGIGALATMIHEFASAPGELDPGRTWSLSTIGFSLIAVLFGAVLLLAVTAEPASALARVLGSRVLRVFGTYSYGIYLMHLPLRAVIREVVFGPSWVKAPHFRFPVILGTEIFGQILFDLIAFGVVLGVAWISFHVFEKRFLELKRFFPTRRAASAVGAG
jgi:peptidoglycan/LPS O-acetylase OafA/YrhL